MPVKIYASYHVYKFIIFNALHFDFWNIISQLHKKHSYKNMKMLIPLNPLHFIKYIFTTELAIMLISIIVWFLQILECYH